MRNNQGILSQACMQLPSIHPPWTSFSASGSLNTQAAGDDQDPAAPPLGEVSFPLGPWAATEHNAEGRWGNLSHLRWHCKKFRPGDEKGYVKAELKLLSLEVSVVIHVLPTKERTNTMICRLLNSEDKNNQQSYPA